MGLRERIAAELTATMHGGDLKLERYAGPPGDPGLFGIAPGDPVWRVHGHATGMLTGGFAALMLQSLHPLAMAGVDQHSDFRADPVGRLNGTVRFITTTTFGSSDAAREVVDLVRRIHTRVHGTAPDGRPYRADDPDLLTWVHTAEVRSFLAGHQAYAPRPLRLTPPSATPTTSRPPPWPRRWAHATYRARPSKSSAIWLASAPNSTPPQPRWTRSCSSAASDAHGGSGWPWACSRTPRSDSSPPGPAPNSASTARPPSAPAGTGPWRRPSDAPSSGGSGPPRSRPPHGAAGGGTAGMTSGSPRRPAAACSGGGEPTAHRVS